MNDTFLKLFPGATGEERGQAADPTGAPGIPGEVAPPTEEPPAPAACVRGGLIQVSLEASDGTVYACDRHRIDGCLGVRRTRLGS